MFSMPSGANPGGIPDPKAAASSHQLIVMVEDIDRSGPKVSREQEHAVDVNAEYRALVNGARRGVGVDGIVDGTDRLISRGSGLWSKRISFRPR